MSETNFTPGPCKTYTDSSGFVSICRADEPILWDGPHFLLAQDVNEDYAPIFAAAPELYAALKAAEQCEAALILQWSNFWDVAPPALIESLMNAQSLRNAALAKAEGKATT